MQTEAQAADVPAETPVEAPADALDNWQDEQGEERPVYRNVDEAVEALRDMQREEEPAEAPTPEPTQEPDRHQQTDDDGPRCWTTAEAETLAQFQRETEAFQHDLSAFAQAKAAAEAEIAKTQDKGRAEMLRQQISDAKQELRLRHEALGQVAGEFQGKVRSHATAKAQRHLDGEKAKLAEKVPDLDKAALKTYLTNDLGFTAEEIAQAGDHRIVVMAEESRRYRELMDGRQGKVPTKKGAKPKADPKADAEYERVLNRGDVREIAEYRARVGPRPKKGEPTVQDLKAQHRKAGTMDSALAVLRAQQ